MFSILSATYKDTHEGVFCYGVIGYNGDVVGDFHQSPGAACIPSFKTPQHKSNFIASAKGKNICDYCEELLCEWENRRMAILHD